MKIKLVIFRKDRTVAVRRVREKKVKDSRVSTKIGECIIEAKYGVLTQERKFLFFKVYYNTFYYREGSPKPLPAPLFAEMPNLGVPSEELEALFNPFFLRTIAAKEMEKWEKMMFMATVGACISSVIGLIMINRLTQMLNEIMLAMGIGG